MTFGLNIDVNDLLRKDGEPEELHPDLQPYLSARTSLGHVLQSPLVYSVPHASVFNRFVNAQYAAKKQALVELTAQANWNGYIFMHERPFRLDAFEEVCDHLDDKSYWSLLGSLWTGSENIHQVIERWSRAWASERPKRHMVMHVSERGALAAMPQRLTVYRGFREDFGEMGMSWTLNRDKAVWFARRHADDDYVAQLASGTVHKDAVLAYFTGRGEEEIVVQTHDVCEMTTMEL